MKIAEAKKPITTVDVWLGKENELDVYTNIDIYKTIKKARKNKLKVALNYKDPEAPINKDEVVTKLKVVYDGELIDEYNLFASKDIKRLNIFSRLMRSLNYLIWVMSKNQ